MKKINAKKLHNPSVEHAEMVIRSLRQQGFSDMEMARRMGVHVRTVYRSLEVGFVKYPMQVLFESLAGIK
jgi:hypothetical protein